MTGYLVPAGRADGGDAVPHHHAHLLSGGGAAGGLRLLLRTQPRPAARGERPDQGRLRTRQTGVAAVPDPSQEHLHGEPRRVLRKLPAARAGRVGGAGSSDAGAVPHRHCAVLLHRVLSGQGHRLAPGGPVRVRRHDIGRDAVYRLHASLRPDDDLGVRLQAGLVSSGQVPGPPWYGGEPT